MFFSSLTLCNTSLFTRSVQQAFSINLHHHILKFQGIVDVRLLSVVSTFQQYSILNFSNIQSVVMEIKVLIRQCPPPDLFQQVYSCPRSHTLAYCYFTTPLPSHLILRHRSGFFPQVTRLKLCVYF